MPVSAGAWGAAETGRGQQAQARLVDLARSLANRSGIQIEGGGDVTFG